MSREDIDDLLGWYLEGGMADAVKREDCEEKHNHLDKEIERALATTAKAVAAHLKVWILGSVLGLVLAAVLTVLYGVMEIGQYKERVDTTTQQLREMKDSSNRQFEDLKQEFRELRNLMLQMGRTTP